MIPHLPIPAGFRIYLRFVHYLLWESLPWPWKKLNSRPSAELVVRADHS